MAQCEKQKNKSHCLTVDPRGVSHDFYITDVKSFLCFHCGLLSIMHEAYKLSIRAACFIADGSSLIYPAMM